MQSFNGSDPGLMTLFETSGREHPVYKQKLLVPQHSTGRLWIDPPQEARVRQHWGEGPGRYAVYVHSTITVGTNQNQSIESNRSSQRKAFFNFRKEIRGVRLLKIVLRSSKRYPRTRSPSRQVDSNKLHHRPRSPNNSATLPLILCSLCLP